MADTKNNTKIYKYVLRPKALSNDIELLTLGTAHLYKGDVTTENNNSYIDGEYIGGFLVDSDCKKRRSINLYLTKDFGDTIYCGYEITSRHNIYYLNQYSDSDVVQTIYIINDIEKVNEKNRDLIDVGYKASTKVRKNVKDKKEKDKKEEEDGR